MTRLLAIRDLNQGDPLPLPGKKVEPPPAEPPRKRPEPVNGNPDILRGPDGKLYTDIDKNKGVRLRHSETRIVTPTGRQLLEEYKAMPTKAARQYFFQENLSHRLVSADALKVGDKVYISAFGSGTVVAVVQDSVYVKLLDGGKMYVRAGDIQLSARPTTVCPKFRSGDRALIWDEGNIYHKKFAIVRNDEHDGLAQVTVSAGSITDTFTIRTEFLRHA